MGIVQYCKWRLKPGFLKAKLDADLVPVQTEGTFDTLSLKQGGGRGGGRGGDFHFYVPWTPPRVGGG